MSKFDPPKLNPAFDHHISHGQGQHTEGHAVKGNLARDGAPKRSYPVKVHGGFHKITQSGQNVLPHVADALDSLTGATVPVGRNVAQAGYGNDGVSHGNPTLKPPGPAKKLTRVQPSFGMKRQTDPSLALHELGDAVLQAAFAASDNHDRQAHGRGNDGAKLPESTKENT